MSSQTRDERGDANRLDLRTLLIASVASAVAAIVVSRVWASGTPIAAAATPVLVTLLKEALDRPTSRIAERFTADTPALPDTDVREPVAAPVRRERAAGERMPAEEEGAGNIRVFRQPSKRATGRIHPKVVLITGLLAFVIAGLVITGGQVLAGHSFGSRGNGAIILGQHKSQSKSKSEGTNQPTTTPEQGQQQQQTTPEGRQQTAPEKQPTTTTPSEQVKPPATTTPQAKPKGGTPSPPATPPASP